jgi:hypothetical protein
MNSSDIRLLRLQNQHLIGKKFKLPSEVVGHLGAVQAQDYFGSMWSVGQRMENATESMIEEAFNSGAIIRTHIMRPTWHFILPEDLIWMQELTKHRVKQLMNTYNKKLELTDEVFQKSNKIIVKSLQNNNYLSRQELKKILEGIGIKTDVQRLAHIIMYAELDALICSGPRRGKQFTYALVNERIQRSKKLNHDEALALLTLKYFQSHGPAQIKDFSWWSGLTMKESTEGVELIKSKLRADVIDGKTYFSNLTTNYEIPTSSPAFLLSIYDEYTIAYKDRSALGGERFIEQFISMGNLLTAVMILNGEVVGTWKRKLTKGSVEVVLRPLRKLTKLENDAFAVAIIKYGEYLRLQVK